MVRFQTIAYNVTLFKRSLILSASLALATALSFWTLALVKLCWKTGRKRLSHVLEDIHWQEIYATKSACNGIIILNPIPCSFTLRCPVRKVYSGTGNLFIRSLKRVGSVSANALPDRPVIVFSYTERQMKHEVRLSFPAMVLIYPIVISDFMCLLKLRT